jgi:hypothetical protein
VTATLAPLTTTGIGSLPQRDVASALDEAFRVDLPYLPQLPIRDPREFMLAQALEGMPGVVVDEQGMVELELTAWKKGRAAYEDRLALALESDKPEPFLSSGPYAAALEPFLHRVRAEARPLAKAQIAGPMTVQWSLRTTDHQVPPAAALTHVSHTILARSLALARAVRSTGAEPVIFLDEPGLYAFSRSQPGHIVLLQELRINVMALKKAGARVGLHCCSDADWGAFLGLGLDILAIDVRLSLSSLLKAGEALVTFVSMGGRLALGVIPTGQHEEAPSVEILLEDMNRRLSTLEEYFPTRASILDSILGRSLLTPACGLALLGATEARRIVDQLDAFRGAYRASRAAG